MYNICKCLQDQKEMLKLLKTDLDRERFLNRSLCERVYIVSMVKGR